MTTRQQQQMAATTITDTAQKQNVAVCHQGRLGKKGEGGGMGKILKRGV